MPNRKKNAAGASSLPAQRTRKRKSGTPTTIKNKKLKVTKNGQQGPAKTYCWLCHKLAQGQTCTCKRVYHNECLENSSNGFQNNKCPECQLKSVDGTELTRPFAKGLKVYLEFATKYIKDKHNAKIWSWPQDSDVVPAIDIESLLKKVMDNVYKTTAEFYADVKWFYHDYCILYGEHSKQSKQMNNVVKDFKEELIDMEACPECYYHLYCKNSDEEQFVRLCAPPHDIIWAKVTGHSHWPAKCLKIVNRKACVRFFGSHEKSDIPINTIFRISEAHPVYEKRNITVTETRTPLLYTYTKGELRSYITLYEENIGKFKFYGFREFYVPDNVTRNVGEQLTNEVGHKKKTSQIELISSAGSAASISSITTSADVPVNSFETSSSISTNNIFEKCLSSTGSATAVPITASTDAPVNPSGTSTTISNNNISVGMTFSIDTPPPVSSTESFSTTSTCSTVNLQNFPMKGEPQSSGQTNRIFSLAESGNLIQFLMKAYITKESPDITKSLLTRLVRDLSSIGALSPSLLVPDLPIIKEDNISENALSTSAIRQSEKEMSTVSMETAATISTQELPEIEEIVISPPPKKEIVVIDLTKDTDEGDLQPTSLLNTPLENSDMNDKDQSTHQVGRLINLFEDFHKMPKPSQTSLLYNTLIKLVEENEKKCQQFREGNENVKTCLKHLEKSFNARM